MEADKPGCAGDENRPISHCHHAHV
jgi:hypothetical protein